MGPRHILGVPAACHRTGADVGPHQPHRRPPREQADLVHRRRLRRRVEDHQRRHHLDAGLRQRRLLLDRLRRRSTRRTRTRSGSAPARTTTSAASATATASTSRRRRHDVEERRPQEVRAHRQDRDRPARLERRLRRRPGPAVDAGRRPRPLQDHRRRQDLDQASLDDQREHRRHRRRASIPRNPDVLLAAALPAPAPRLDADQRRPRERASTSRPTAARPGGRSRTGLPGGDLGPHRPGVLAGADPDSSTRSSKPPGNAAASTARSTRGDSWERARQRRGAADVLPEHLRRSEGRRPRLRAERADAGLRGRRPDVPTPRRAQQARRQPRVWIDPDNTDHLLGAATAASTRASTAARLWRTSATCRSPSSTTSTSTTRRRSTTSTAARRTTSRSAARRGRAAPHGITNTDWFVVTGGDGFVPRIDPSDPNIVYGESQYGGSCASTAGPASASSIQPSRRQGRAGAALELGLAAHHQPAQPDAALLRRQPPVPQRRPRRHLEGGQSRTSRARSTATSCR